MQADERVSAPPVVFGPPGHPARRNQPGRGGNRPAPLPPPKRWSVDAAAAAIGIGLGVSVGLALADTTGAQLAARGGFATFLGSLTGLAGTYLALVMLLLVSRIPAVERVIGQDGLLRWHRRLAPWPIGLITAHVLLLTVGYAQAARNGIWAEFVSLVGVYPSVAAATIAFGLLLLIALASISSVRRRLRRETWWRLHVLMYLVFALAFVHEISLGPSFIGHPLTRIVWTAVWLATAGSLLGYRVGLPILRTRRHRLQVVEVRQETPDITSIICRGRALDRLQVCGGQFFEWRFLVPGLWWQAHPFSLSARPNSGYLRLTVKNVGDFTSAISRLKPGTRVAIEGPYGAFTVHARRRTKCALIAGGIGVTAVRSLLEDLPKKSEPVVVLRASTEQHLALAGEVRDLAQRNKGRVHELLGGRDDVSLAKLFELIPDLARRDVFVAGREGFVLAVVEYLAKRGIPRDCIHHEVFTL